MVSNKERLELLEARLGRIQNVLQHMEVGLIDRLHQMEETIQKLFKAVLSNITPSNHNTHEREGLVHSYCEETDGGCQLFSSKVARIEFPRYSGDDPTEWFSDVGQIFEYQEPNRVTMVSALAACASFGATELGVWIHEFIRRRGWELDVILGTELVYMYGKCGRIEEGLKVFLGMTEKNVFTLNAVIKGLALVNSGEEVVSWFNKMEQEGDKANEVTLVGVLCACSHSGLVNVGQEIFNSLIDGKYGFSPGVNHYPCMIDLFAQAGLLEDAFKLITEMPYEPTKSMWGSLLAGCRDQGNLERRPLSRDEP